VKNVVLISSYVDGCNMVVGFIVKDCHQLVVVNTERHCLCCQWNMDILPWLDSIFFAVSCTGLKSVPAG